MTIQRRCYRKAITGIVTSACAAFLALPTITARADWIAIYLHNAASYQSQSFAAAGATQGGWARMGGIDRPVLWNSSAQSMQVLLPQTGGWLGGEVRGMNGSRQVGWLGNQDGRLHAAVWEGSGDSFVDLDPMLAQYRGTQANAIRGNQAVGTAHYYFGNQAEDHAAVWNVAQGTFRDIHPGSGFSQSRLFATDGEYQGGWANPGVRVTIHAAMWHGTPESYVNLHPSIAHDSQVEGMAPGVQVGYATTPAGAQMAALWHGTAESFQNLNPVGAYAAEIHATTGSIHVGSVFMNSGHSWDPCVWMSDSPSSFINLRQFLAPGWGDAGATSVSIDGDRIYVTGSGAGLNGTVEALLWVGTVPAPGTAMVLGFGMLLGGRRTQRRAR
ncbi:MAG: hypothetical protein AABZ53_02065 [Planctomycetota bacterium]